MKSLFALLATISLLPSVQASDNPITIDPSQAYECKNHDDASNLNSIYGPTIVSETQQDLTVQFFVVYGDCRNGKFIPDALNPQGVQFYFMDNRTQWPWDTAPYRYITARYGSDTVVIARVTFQRAAIMNELGNADLMMEVSRETSPNWSFGGHRWRMRINRVGNSSRISISGK